MLSVDASASPTPRPFVWATPKHSELLDRSRASELVQANEVAPHKQDKRSHLLFYRYLDTSEVVSVPNDWYNQPVQWRLDKIRADIKYIQNHIDALEAGGQRPAEPGRTMFMPAEEARLELIADERARIARLESIAAEMELTGVVMH